MANVYVYLILVSYVLVNRGTVMSKECDIIDNSNPENQKVFFLIFELFRSLKYFSF